MEDAPDSTLRNSDTKRSRRQKSLRRTRPLPLVVLPPPDKPLPDIPNSESSLACPESATLPKSSSGAVVDDRMLYAIQRKGDTVQYWVLVEDVLSGGPGVGGLPPGHWGGMVQLASAVYQQGARQFLTGWYVAEEPERGEHPGR